MLITVGHQKHNGKSHVARILSAVFGLPIGAFAAPGKLMVADLFGMNLEEIDFWKNQPVPPPGWDKTMREALQYFLNGARTFKPTIWLDKALASDHQVIEDMRYYNDLEVSAARGGFNLFVVRPGFENNDLSAHISESQLTTLRLKLCKEFPQGGPTHHHLVHYLLFNDGTPHFCDPLIKHIKRHFRFKTASAQSLPAAAPDSDSTARHAHG